MKNLLFKTLTIITLTFFITNCSSDDAEPISNATNNTTEANAEITFTTMKLSGKVNSNDGNEITSQGVCWSKNPNPTISNDKVTENTTTFSTVISDLTVNTTYYFRIFATTSAGTTYSKELSLKTLSLGNTNWKFTVIDHNDNEVLANVNFKEDNTTKYIEECTTGIDCYAPEGTWSIEGNILTYIGENDDPATSTHVFTGTITALNLQGTYKHITDPDGTWNAVLN